MTSIADIELPAEPTGLGELFEAVPSLSCEIEQVIASNERSLWLSGPNQPEIENALERSSSVTHYSRIANGDDEWLYEITFEDGTVDPFDVVIEEDGTVLNASAADGTWVLSVRFLDREGISRLYDRFVETDVRPQIVRLFDLSDETYTQCGLTSQQYETLVAAIDHGYFKIPREVSMQELSDELGISHQALSERLRRAYHALAASEVGVKNRVEVDPPMSSA